jgi:hypothetical protein
VKYKPKVELQPQTDSPDLIRPVDYLLILMFGVLITIATINHPLNQSTNTKHLCEVKR